MEDRSNIRQKWFSPGTRIVLPSGDLLFDVLIRLDERVATRETEDGKTEIEYIYEAQRVDILFPAGMTQAAYLDSIKGDILQKVIRGEKVLQEKIKVSQDTLNSAYLERLSAESFKVSSVEELKL